MRKKGGGSEWRQVRNMEALESENDSYIDDLEARVQGLKEVRGAVQGAQQRGNLDQVLSLAMRDEVQASNTLLGSLVGRLEGVRVSVRNSVRRMDQMFKAGEEEEGGAGDRLLQSPEP
ncbi:hypothetical protein Esti_003311 [Eimeria stiedai]